MMKKKTWSRLLVCMLFCFLFAGILTVHTATETQAATYKGYVLKGGTYYYYNTQGKLVKGWLKNKYGTYYFDEKTGAAKSGILTISGKKYCFNNRGKMLIGWQTVEGKKYFFNKAHGYMHTGWLTTTTGNRYYFFDDGVIRPGWQKVSGKLYYFNSYGLMMRNRIIKVGTRKFYLDNNGQRLRGLFKVNGKWYAALTSTGALVIDDWYEGSDGSMYYTDETGALRTGFYKPDAYYRYFRPSDGKMLTGWQDIGKYRYLFHTKNGRMFADRKLTLNGKMYYFTAHGKLYRNGFFTKSGKTYYAYSTGSLATGLKTINGNQYYFDSEGVRQVRWVAIDGKKYYFHPTTGIMQKNKWITSNYYVGADGAWIKGYKEYNFQWPLDSNCNWISSYFGPRTAPGPNASTNHKGIDIASKTESVNGKPIYAIGDGTVVLVSPESQSGGAGNYTRIDHGDGVISGYMHQSSFVSGLKVGMKVKKGQLIGYVGNTGTSYGAHLHLEIIVNGEYQNPLNYVTVPTS